MAGLQTHLVERFCQQATCVPMCLWGARRGGGSVPREILEQETLFKTWLLPSKVMHRISTGSTISMNVQYTSLHSEESSDLSMTKRCEYKGKQQHGSKDVAADRKSVLQSGRISIHVFVQVMWTSCACKGEVQHSQENAQARAMRRIPHC